MLPFPVPTFDQQRLEVLQRYRVLAPEGGSNETQLAEAVSLATAAPIVIAVVTERHRGRFACHHGLTPIQVAPLAAICARSNLAPEPFVVPDLSAEAEFDPDALRAHGIEARVLAGVPMRSATSERLGTLCALSPERSAFGGDRLQGLVVMADLVAQTLVMRSAARYALADLVEAERVKRRYYDLAMTDGLTGALNRRAFLSIAHRDLARCTRHGGGLSVVAFDVDNFKAVNDTHGHAAGDAVLRELSSTLLGMVREEDAFGRMGGEEFALALPETTPADASRLAERLRKAASGMVFDGPDGAFSVTISLGVAAARPGQGGIEDALARADAALYAAKNAGRNQVRAA